MKKSDKPWMELIVFGRFIPVYKIPGLLEDGRYGFYDTEKHLICVDASLKGDALNQTLLHELFHATLHRLYCRMSPEFEEVVVENLVVGLFDNFKLLKRN